MTFIGTDSGGAYEVSKSATHVTTTLHDANGNMCRLPLTPAEARALAELLMRAAPESEFVWVAGTLLADGHDCCILRNSIYWTGLIDGTPIKTDRDVVLTYPTEAEAKLGVETRLRRMRETAPTPVVDPAPTRDMTAFRANLRRAESQRTRMRWDGNQLNFGAFNARVICDTHAMSYYAEINGVALLYNDGRRRVFFEQSGAQDYVESEIQRRIDASIPVRDTSDDTRALTREERDFINALQSDRAETDRAAIRAAPVIRPRATPKPIPPTTKPKSRFGGNL